ncbi:thiamine pyrophosphate-binding protein [Mangrovibacterium marinum]|uniref:thiamine pyrophosphate-binding protein n=1 Tax=Mangrovibacterium marinum TaxID=1639118 RepID=UPI002A187C3F|nr:thiamine pyrophosphate-binding protein [Mangrovibacterium marinum]
MNTFYSSEKSIQILIALLKAHKIKKVVTSPGGTNMMLNASLQYDGSFDIYSSIDERSAAYIACGIATESGEPVMITCTGATASRNYMPGLTEAFYRKLPILVVTGTQDMRRLGNLYDQVIDRTVHAKDVVTFSTYIPSVRDEKDADSAALKINQAISALTLNGGGPSHINLETIYSKDLSIKQLPTVKIIRRIDYDDEFPELPDGKIAIFIGSHKQFSTQETALIDKFCEHHNAVVFCDHTSGYKGEFRQLDALLHMQNASCLQDIRLLIHLGEVSGDHFNMGSRAQEVWRVNKDGQLRDRYGKLTYLFNTSESHFLKSYTAQYKQTGTSFLQACKDDYKMHYAAVPKLPFSNIWMAKQLAPRLPENSTIHFGILTSLRSWDFFEISKTINSASNVGGFGTDGMLSSLLGASLVNPQKLYFGIVGDHAFFYDMNALGNRHLGNNLRILLVNNGKGCEFTHHLNPGHIFKNDVDLYIAAAGHFGNKSQSLVRNYARNLGMEYMTAGTKEEFVQNMDIFIDPKISKSCVFEVFTNDFDENEALKLITSTGKIDEMKKGVKDGVKNIVGQKGVNMIKGLFK